MSNCTIMDKWTVLFLLCLPDTAVCWTADVQVQNMSNLFTKYSEYCGSDYLCCTYDKKGQLEVPEHCYSNNCPPCSCSDDCDPIRNCCLEESYTSCVPTTVPIRPFKEESGFQMVSFCPKTFHAAYSNCLQPITGHNFLAQIPVYSLTTNKTYVNSNCSKCHGDNKTIPWRYYISCPNISIDVDDYTDAPNLWNGMMQRGCFLTLTPPVNTFQRRCNVNALIRTCNITGEWDEYDKEIEDACTHYRKPYGLYENIFCLLCNTGKEQRGGFLLKNIKSTETFQSCECERNNTNCLAISDRSYDNFTVCDRVRQVLYYDDALVTFLEKYNASKKKYVVNISLISVNLTKIIKNIFSGNDVLNESPDFESAVNLTALYEEYVRSGGYRNWCFEDHRVDKIFPGFKARRDCNCDDNCYKSASCCPDAAYFQRSACSAANMKHPYAFDNELNTSFYFMIRKCPLNYRYPSIKLKCESNDDYGLRNIPVVNLQTNNTYLNIYCYLCNIYNKQGLDFLDIKNITFWNVSLICPTLLFPGLQSSIDAFLKIAFEKFCSVKYSSTITNLADSCKPEIPKSIGICNMTGSVKSVSESARYMCENIARDVMAKSRNSMFKNQICDLCNNEIFEEPISHCYMFVPYQYITDKYNCENGALDEQSYPFKNKYCKVCNQVNESGSDVNENHDNEIVTLRDLFASIDVDEELAEEQLNKCSESEFTDTYKNKCRKLLCSRGKMLNNDTCSYFIPYVREVQYNIALRILISSNSSAITFRSVIDNLQEILQQEVNEGQIYIEDKYVYSNVSCSSQVVEPFSDISILFIRLRIQNNQFPIDRNRLEMHLLGLTNVTISFNGVFISFQKSLDAWFLPIREKQNKLDSYGCFMKNTSSTSKYTFNINNLLVCPQIELTLDEYVSQDYISIYVKSLDRRYSLNEFLRATKGSVRICANSYKRARNVSSLSNQKTLVEIGLMVVTYICTILSLLFLLATILVYCMFSVLRTLPGKNIMCYALSLFLAQLFFIIRSYITDKIACAWIGGFTHYFWIAVFACTNICCLHMFRLFVKNALKNNDVYSDRNIFVKYCLASLLLPLLPVTLNLILSYTEIESMKFGYGGSKCFLLSHKALILMFILPIFLQIIFNIVMFSITFHYIRNTPKVKSSQDRHDFTIFLKLFLLTGVSWLFMIVDGFFDVSPFTFLATIVNGAQGLFIFISYACHKRIFKFFKELRAPLHTDSANNFDLLDTSHTATTQL